MLPCAAILMLSCAAILMLSRAAILMLSRAAILTLAHAAILIIMLPNLGIHIWDLSIVAIKKNYHIINNICYM